MKHRFRVEGYALCLGLTCLAGWLVFTSCTEFRGAEMVPVQIEGASYMGNQSCHDCHTQISQAFHASPHARVDVAHTQSTGLTGCESCHGPGSKHSAAGGGKSVFISNPGSDPQACLECHRNVQAEFHLPHHHPMEEGELNCVVCHDPHGMDIMKREGGLAMARDNNQCGQCHEEQARLFVFGHEALEEGCAACHQPHGSVHASLLTERDNNLCLKCHAQVQVGGGIFIGGVNHTPRLRQGTCWTAGCHSAVHGSNIHPRLLY